MTTDDKALMDLLKQSGPKLLQQLRDRRKEWDRYSARLTDRQMRAKQTADRMDEQIRVLEISLGAVEDDVPEAIEDEPE